MEQVEPTVTERMELKNYIVESFKRGDLSFDETIGLYTLRENRGIVKENGDVQDKKEVFSFTKADIDAAIDKTYHLYGQILQINDAGITMKNAPNMREEARLLKDAYDTYKTIYLNAPLENGERITALDKCWNFLASKKIIDYTSENRFSDYTQFYLRVYRLIYLMEIKAPALIIHNELAMISSSFIRKDHFIEFEAEKDADKEMDYE